MAESEEKRDQVARLYGGMSEAELKNLAEEATSLTETGKELLRAELARRGLEFDLAMVDTATPEVPSRDIVTLRQFRDMPDALLAKGFLESAGVESFLVDETTIRMDWLWSNLLGGIKLCVDAKDAEEAALMLSQEIPEGFNFDGAGDFEQPKCPKCGSLNISFEDWDKRVAYAGMLFLGFPIPLHRREWKCESCGHVWQLPSDESPKNI
jgi:hypothetical protein